MRHLSLGIIYGGCYFSFSVYFLNVRSLGSMTLNAKYDCFSYVFVLNESNLGVRSQLMYLNATISALNIYTVQSFAIFLMLTFLFSCLKFTHSHS